MLVRRASPPLSQKETEIRVSLNGSNAELPVAVRWSPPDASAALGNSVTTDRSKQRSAEQAQEHARAELLCWMHLGSSIACAAILVDVSICRVLDWLDEAERNPQSRYREFPREANQLECRLAMTQISLKACGTALNPSGPPPPPPRSHTPQRSLIS